LTKYGLNLYSIAMSTLFGHFEGVFTAEKSWISRWGLAPGYRAEMT